MRVLHVIPSLAASHGGPTLALAMMERALKLQGIDVETATTDENGFGRRNGTQCLEPLNENGVTRRYFPLRLAFYKISPGFARWIFRHAGDYDLLHIHALFSFTSLAAVIAARRSGVPYIVRPLGTLNRYGITQRRPWLKRVSLALIEAPIVRNAAAVHFTSDAERLEAEALDVPMRSRVVPLGVEDSDAANESAFLTRFPELRGVRRILFLSRLDAKKNVEGLLHALDLCREVLSETRLVVAGDGKPAYIASLKALCNQLGLADRVIWSGHLVGELKASAFACADVFVLPSFSENFGIAAAEALMAGLPCILGAGVALSKEVVDAEAGLMADSNPESIAQGLTQLMTDEPLRARMAINASHLAKDKFSSGAMGRALANLYSDLVPSRATERE